MEEPKVYNGVININKEAGFTSMDVVAKMRGILKMKKIGHTGTLDPAATGVLPVCVGKGTKLVEKFMADDKVYRAVMLLGVTTDSQDMTGEVLTQKEVNVSEKEVLEVIGSFVGGYDQLPPMYSAKKVNGKKLVDLARKGIEVELKPAPITIYDLKINYIKVEDGAVYASFDVKCSKGTYIRKICDDLGELTGFGAHAVELRRTICGPFKVEDAYTEEELKAMKESGNEDFLVDAVTALNKMPRLQVNSKTFAAIKQGKKTPVPEGVEYGVKYAAFYEDTLAAILYKNDEEDGKTVMRIERMLATDA